MPPPKKATDELAARAMLAWLRANKFAAATVTVGSVTIEGIVDLGMAGLDPRVPTRQDAESLLAKFGGPALKQALGEDALDDEDEPALGRRR